MMLGRKSKKEKKISVFAWGKFLTTTKISTLALFEGFFAISEVGISARSISTFSFSFCFKQACFSRVQKSLIQQKCLFPEQVACSTPTAPLAAVAESCKKMLEPPTWRVHRHLHTSYLLTNRNLRIVIIVTFMM